MLRPAATAFGIVLVLASIACNKTAPVTAPPPPEVVVMKVIQKDVPIYSEWVGTTEGFVNAQIHPKVSGYLLKQNYQDGDHVTEGQLLFQIDDREYKAALDQALGEPRPGGRPTQEEPAGPRALHAALQGGGHQQAGVRSPRPRRPAQARPQVQAAQAAVETARLNLQWTRVNSPIDGIAGIAKAQVGDLVSPTTLLTTVSQLDPIKVTFPISEREYLHFADRIKRHQENGAAKNEPELEMILADGSPTSIRAIFTSPIGRSTCRPARS